MGVVELVYVQNDNLAISPFLTPSQKPLQKIPNSEIATLSSLTILLKPLLELKSHGLLS